MYVYKEGKNSNFFPYTVLTEWFLDAFAKFHKAIARPSVRPHRIIYYPLDGFSWNLMFEYFYKKLSRKLKFYQNLTKITGTLRGAQYTVFFIISRSVLLRMRKASDKSYTENQNTQSPSMLLYTYIGCLVISETGCVY